MNINNLRYADDCIDCRVRRGTKETVNKVKVRSEKYGLRMNGRKTKTMAISRDRTPQMKIEVDGQVLEQVKRFKYLKQVITDDGRCNSEIRIRIEIAKNMLTSRKLNLNLQKSMSRCYILSSLLCVGKTWTAIKKTTVLIISEYI